MTEQEKKNYTHRKISDFNQDKIEFQKFGRWLVIRVFAGLFYKIEYTGRENIPKDKRFIVAPNHISYFDPFLMGEATDLPIAFMGKKELFEVNELLSKTLDRLACFAVNREKLDVSTIKTALNIFKTEKWFLGIFPQGGIRRNKRIEKINKGFAVFAKQMKTDILPIGITGCEKYNWIPFFGKIKVSIGEIISYDQEYDQIIDEWGKTVAALAGYEYIKEPENSSPGTKKEKSTI